MAYKEFGATIAPANVSSTGFPIAMGTHIGGGRIVNNKTTLNLKHWCLLGEGATLNDQKANAIGQIWYDISDNKYWKLDSWASTNPVWVDVSTIFATKSYVDTAIENIPDPMIFKGSLGTGGTITSLPTASTSNTGFTYKVITAGTYADQVAKIGDTFISDGTIWNLIPSGDEPTGTVTSITLNATSPILIDDSNAITTSGTRTFSHASTSGNKHIPSGGNSNNYLKWDSDGTATWSALPTASTSVAGVTTVGTSGGAASYVHTHAKSDITDFDHNHNTVYLGLTATAADSDKLDGKDSTDFSLAGHGHGYMNGDGTITDDAIIAKGDRIIIADSDDWSKLKRTSIEFDPANRKFLREDGIWSDTPFPGVATTSVDGLMTNTDKIKVNQLDLDSVLGNAISNYDCLVVLDASDSYKMKRGPEFKSNGYNPNWYLSAEGTWKTLKYRAIQVNGTGHVGPAVDNPLNFVDGDNTTMSLSSNVGVTSIQVNCNPTSYLHNHRLLFSGKVSINPGQTSGTYTEGLRIGNSSAGVSLIALGTDGTETGVTDNQWHIMKLPTGELVLTYDNSVNSGLTLEKDGSIKWRSAPLVVGSRIVSGVTSKTMEFNPETSDNFDIVLGENSKYIMPVHDPSMLVSKDIVIHLSTLGSEQDFSESEVTLEIPYVMREAGDLNITFETGDVNIFYNENFRLISELEGEGNMLYRIRYIEQMDRWSISSELFMMK